MKKAKIYFQDMLAGRLVEDENGEERKNTGTLLGVPVVYIG